MNFFTSDLHLGHKNVISMCNRPYSGTDEMDGALIENWNEKVKNGDTVYVIGDLIWETADPVKYLERLSGKKVLITGNHDEKWLKRYGCENYFELITPYLETEIDGVKITMCHYPMLEWRASRKLGSRKLGYHIHGHIHNNYRELYRQLFLTPHALNADTDITGFTPATFEELVAFNEEHKLNMLPSLEDKALFIAGKYHLYQSDKSGRPYIEHPVKVASMVEGEILKCCALLHDTLEDTPVTAEYLLKYFPAEVVETVKVLTRPEGEDYFAYINGIALNPLAKKVKLADLTHNMDMTRFRTVTDRDLQRLEKYKKAYAILTEKC